MSNEPNDILQLALSLPDSERASIAATLFNSLDPGADADATLEWATEIKRRLATIDNGDVTLVPWDDVMSEMHDRRNG